MDIKVLGPGCAKCTLTEELVREVVERNNIDATVEKISDIKKIAGFGVFMTPAVVIDGDVKCVGKVPKKEEVESWVGVK